MSAADEQGRQNKRGAAAWASTDPGGGRIGGVTRTPARPTRFRHHAAVAVAGLIGLIGAVPLASTAWYLTPILLIPFAVMVWAWLAGTDAGPDGLVVRALLGRRRIPWSAVVDLRADAQGRAYASLSDGTAVPLPAVTADDLRRLVATSGSLRQSG